MSIAKKLIWSQQSQWCGFVGWWHSHSHIVIMLESTCARRDVILSSKRSTHSTSLNDVKLNGKQAQFGSYKDAIHALNALQTNSQTLQLCLTRQINNLEETWKYLRRSGIELEELDKLPVIHVSGTKGKGSTCALLESILRSYGLKTGFFSSPHLTSVTERIRINSKSISKDTFTKHFWKIYNRLNRQKDYESDMPAYFKFLTLLSYHIFFDENVDVAIYEVGIGGEKDCTNILRTTKTVGITSLGLEHTTLLGNTLAEIARQKAGIIKPGSNVFTVQQPDGCLSVIRQVATERKAKLFIVPEYCDYQFHRLPNLQIKSKVQHLNASLAIQLAYDWLQRNHVSRLNGLVSKQKKPNMIMKVSKEMVDGLESCMWPGRCQVIKVANKTIHLDGAHTADSLEVCADWFLSVSKDSVKPKCLIFNATGDRDSEQLMDVLARQIKFKTVLFVPNVAFTTDDEDETSEIICWASKEQIQRAQDHSRLWPKLQNTPNVAAFSTILDAILFIDEQYAQEEIDILITGSLNLIGSSLVALEKYHASGHNDTYSSK